MGTPWAQDTDVSMNMAWTRHGHEHEYGMNMAWTWHGHGMGTGHGQDMSMNMAWTRHGHGMDTGTGVMDAPRARGTNTACAWRPPARRGPGWAGHATGTQHAGMAHAWHRGRPPAGQVCRRRGAAGCPDSDGFPSIPVLLGGPGCRWVPWHWWELVGTGVSGGGC